MRHGDQLPADSSDRCRRFWHATDTVMLRVSSFVRQRIPEVVEVTLSSELSSIVDDNRLNSGRLF